MFWRRGRTGRRMRLQWRIPEALFKAVIQSSIPLFGGVLFGGEIARIGVQAV